MLPIMLSALAVAASAGDRPSFQRAASQGSRVMERLLEEVNGHELPSNTRRRLDDCPDCSGDGVDEDGKQCYMCQGSGNDFCGLSCQIKKAAKYAGSAMNAAGDKLDAATGAAIKAVIKGGKKAAELADTTARAAGKAISEARGKAFDLLVETIKETGKNYRLDMAEDWFWPELAAYGRAVRTDNFYGKWKGSFWGGEYVNNSCTSCDPLAEALINGLESCYEHRDEERFMDKGDRCYLTKSEQGKLQVIANATAKHLKEHNVKTRLHTSVLYLKTIIRNAEIANPTSVSIESS